MSVYSARQRPRRDAPGLDDAALQPGPGGRHHPASGRGHPGQPQLRAGAQGQYLETAGDPGRRPGKLYAAKLGWGALVLAGLLALRSALFLGVGLRQGFRGAGASGAVRALHRSCPGLVSLMVYALQQGLSMRFANQAVALVCGIFGQLSGAALPAVSPGDHPVRALGLLRAAGPGRDGLERDHPHHPVFLAMARPRRPGPAVPCGRRSFCWWVGRCSCDKEV